MPTTVIKSIKPGGGGDYLSLAAWDAGQRADITGGGNNTIQIAEIYGGGNAGPWVTDDSVWVTDATHPIIVRAATGQGHGGVFNATKAYITGNTFDFLELFHLGWVFFGQGISIEDDNGGGTSFIADVNTVDQPVVLDGMIVKVHNSIASLTDSFFMEGSGTAFHIIKNCVVYDDPTAGLLGNCVNATGTCKVKAYNNTFISQGTNGSTVVRKSGGATYTSQNNYMFTANSPDIYSGVTPGSKDATGPVSGGTEAPTYKNIPHSLANFHNVTFATADYHLAAASSLIGIGADLTSEGVTTDFEGEARTVPFDIGADKFTASVPTGGKSFFIFGL